MTAPYNDTIPNVTDPMAISCQQLRNNMNQIYNSYSKNHVNLTQNTNIVGMHTQLEMVNQGSSDPTTLLDEVSLYSKNGTGSQPQVFFRPSNNGTSIQISSNQVISTFPYCQSFIAGPYVLLFGKITGYINNTPILFSNYYPGIVFSEIEYIDITQTGSLASQVPNNHVACYNITNLGFTVKTNINASDFYYLVIGKP